MTTEEFSNLRIDDIIYTIDVHNGYLIKEVKIIELSDTFTKILIDNKHLNLDLDQLIDKYFINKDNYESYLVKLLNTFITQNINEIQRLNKGIFFHQSRLNGLYRQFGSKYPNLFRK